MKQIIKYWKSSLQNAQPQMIRRVTTADDCLRRKIRMTKIQLKADFEKESKLFLAEFQKPDCFQSANCTEYVLDIMNRHLDVLYTNCIKNYIQFCVLNCVSVLNMRQDATA